MKIAQEAAMKMAQERVTKRALGAVMKMAQDEATMERALRTVT